MLEYTLTSVLKKGSPPFSLAKQNNTFTALWNAHQRNLGGQQPKYSSPANEVAALPSLLTDAGEPIPAPGSCRLELHDDSTLLPDAFRFPDLLVRSLSPKADSQFLSAEPFSLSIILQEEILRGTGRFGKSAGEHGCWGEEASFWLWVAFACPLRVRQFSPQGFEFTVEL